MASTTPDLRLHSQPQDIAALRQVPNHTAWCRVTAHNNPWSALLRFIPAMSEATACRSVGRSTFWHYRAAKYNLWKSCAIKANAQIPLLRRVRNIMTSIYLFVCMLVCIRSHISETVGRTSPNILCILRLAVARSSSDRVAICYCVHPVLWMTLCLHM